MSSIAIIGSGISGMAAAYLLHQADHQITLYESAPRIGGHTRTLTIDYDGISMPVDTGFIVYNKPNYPHLTALFRHLGVATQKSEMSFAISIDGGSMEWGARNLNSVFAQRSNLINPRFYRVIKDVLRFNKHAAATAAQRPELTLGGLLDQLRLSTLFKDYYLLPMAGAIWSCSPQTMLDFSAMQFIQFFKNHGLLTLTGQHQWYTVAGGSQCYVDKLTAPFKERILTSCGVTRVSRDEKGVQITDTRGTSESYDQVIFACHANDTLRMLTDPSEAERRLLSAFTYQRNIAYLHCDESLMPKRKACWASWVYNADHIPNGLGREKHISVTYWMNLLQSLDMQRPLFVTLNPGREIHMDLVFDRHEFEHPVFTQKTLEAQQALPTIQGNNKSWFCGAYTRYGFHEDGLLSAVNVAQAMGVNIPWQ